MKIDFSFVDTEIKCVSTKKKKNEKKIIHGGESEKFRYSAQNGDELSTFSVISLSRPTTILFDGK